MVDGELNFITKLDKTGFDKGTKAINNGLGNLKSQLKSLAKVAAAAFSVKMIYDFAKASKEAYNVQIEQETKLATIMQQRMGATDDVIDSVKQLASEQQKLGVIGDEVQLAGAQQVATFLNEADSIKTLLPAMNDLLAQQNGLNATTSDAVNIGNLMGKVLQGQTSALKRVGISFSDAEEQVLKYGTESERAAMLAQVITNNVGHMNQALAQTDAGKQKQLANTMGDVKEQFGQAVMQIESVFLPVIQLLANGLSKIASIAQKVGSAIKEAFGVESSDNSATVATTTATAAEAAAESYEDMADSAEETKKAQENSLASFDKVIKLNKAENSDSAKAGGSGNAQGKKTGVTTLPVKPSKFVSWADELKKTIKKGDWGGVGKLIADKVNNAFGRVDWERLRKKVRSGVKKVTDAINGFVRNFKWKSFGQEVGQGITTIFTAAYDFLKNTKWIEIGSGFAKFLNGVIQKTNFNLVGRTFAAKINAMIGLAWGFVKDFDFKAAGVSFGDLINGWVDELNLAELGKTISTAAKGILDFLTETIQKVNWERVGKKISEFINSINWGGILSSLFSLIGSIIKATPKLLKGIIESLDFENASALFAILFAPKLAKTLLGAFTSNTNVTGLLKKSGSKINNTIGSELDGKSMGSGFGSKLANGLSAASAVIQAAIAGWQLGTLIYNAAKPGIDKITDALTGPTAQDSEKTAEAQRSVSNLRRLQEAQKFINKWGLNTKISREDVDKNRDNYKVVRDIMTILEKYPSVVAAGYHPSRLLADPDLRNDILKGKLPKGVTAKQPDKSEREKINEKIAEQWKLTAERQARKEYKGKENVPGYESMVQARSKAIYERWKAAKTIPFLARGTVVPANFGRFAAILGDNKREPEIVSPLSTMEQAVLAALAKHGGQKQSITIPIYLNTRSGTRLLSKVIIDDINDIIKSTGRVPININ